MSRIIDLNGSHKLFSHLDSILPTFTSPEKNRTSKTRDFKPFFKLEKSCQVTNNPIHMIEFAIIVWLSPDTLSESIRNLIMVLYKPSWWFYIMLTFASIFKDLMLKSASLTQILYWSHVEYSTWPDMSIFEKYGSRAF